MKSGIRPPKGIHVTTSTQSSPLKARIKTADLQMVRKLFKKLQMKQYIDINNTNNNSVNDNSDNESSSNSDNESNYKNSSKKKANKELTAYIMKLQEQFNILNNEYRKMEAMNDKNKQEIKQLKLNNNDLVVQLEEAKKGVIDLLDNFRILQKKMVEVTKKKDERENHFKALLLDSKEKTEILEQLKKKDVEFKTQNQVIQDNRNEMNSLMNKNNLLQISIENSTNKLELACSLNEELTMKLNNKDNIIAKLRQDIETSENNSYRLQAELIRIKGQNTLLKAALDTKTIIESKQLS